ncbi:MAG: HEAT repeat domain-containing protein [Gemmatimonadota bacterium]|nr:MAG: HEAT repeat domain-containing protein [Gemmatimonadota bacterium]
MKASWMLSAVGAALLLAPTAYGQSIADRVAEVRDGKVRMSFAARPDVCGNGRGSIAFGRGEMVVHRRTDDWECDCEYGPVRVVMRIRDREIRDIDTYVGGRWRSVSGTVVDLETVSAPEAADYFVSLARRLDGDVGKEAILPAVLADSAEVWPELLEVAKDGSVPRGTRKSAVFWLGQAAGAAATAGLTEIVADESGDRKVRETAIFALSQRPAAEGVPALIQVVRTNPDPALVKKALFWLAQSEDRRVIDLFEELLTRR